jgi:hypothetical protein
VRITPFGGEARRALAGTSDLGVMAASGNMYCTGDPDRADPFKRADRGYAHWVPRPLAADAPASGLPAGRPPMQEVVLIANMAAPGRYPGHEAAGQPARQHRAHPRDPADATGSCRSLRRQGAGAQPRDPHQARRGDGASTPTRSSTATGTPSTRTLRRPELAAIEAAVRSTSRATMQRALRHRARPT